MPQSSVDIRDVMTGFDRLKRVSGSDERNFWGEVRPDAALEIRSHRKGLKARAKATKQQHGRGQVLGKVLTSYRWRAGSTGLDGLSRVPYSLALEQGAVVGNRATLPARPFAYWGDRFIASVADGWAKFAVKRAW
jgi:hypothetical protein